MPVYFARSEGRFNLFGSPGKPGETHLKINRGVIRGEIV